MHWKCRVYAWLYHASTYAPWDNAPHTRTTRWDLFTDWLPLNVCEACDEIYFDT